LPQEESFGKDPQGGSADQRERRMINSTRSFQVYLLGVGTILLTICLPQKNAQASPEIMSLNLEARPDGAEWSIVLTTKGGNLGKGERTQEILVKSGAGEGIETDKPSAKKPTIRKVSISPKQLDHLVKTIEAVDAWNLGDFDKPALDSADYSIRLQSGDKRHEMTVRGVSKSDPHLKLILAIEGCFSKGATE
jgi:hypothetical protein